MVEAQEREEPLSEAKAGKILDAVYEKTLNGLPMVSRSVDEIADDYLSHHDPPEAAARHPLPSGRSCAAPRALTCNKPHSISVMNRVAVS